MNKNTIITILSIVIVVLAIALFNNYQDDQRYHYEVSQTIEKMKHDLKVMGNKIENKANQVKEDLKN